MAKDKIDNDDRQETPAGTKRARQASALGWIDAAATVAAESSAIVVHPGTRGTGSERAAEAQLEEAVNLAEAIQLNVAASRLMPIRKPRPSHMFGSGQVATLAQQFEETGASLLIVDGTLSPVQQRNLETDLQCKVIDRTGLILEIFGDRAQSREGVLQVELAHLTYQQSRLVRSWTHLERQRGGFGFLGGPGETQIETDRRLIRDRIAGLNRELAQVKRTRTLHRHNRKRSATPMIALVGYTNAGKSTLFNALTHADVAAKDMLFATLDPTMRAIDLPRGQRAILSDTVGFVSNLPTQLVAAFQATLEEVRAADLLLHVRDISHADSEAQKQDVENILAQLGIGDDALEPVTPQPLCIEVLNKVDLLSPDLAAQVRAVAARRDNMVVISAHSGEGLAELNTKIADCFAPDPQTLTLQLGFGEGRKIAWLYRNGEVLSQSEGVDSVELKVRLSGPNIEKFRNL